ncbi:MAG: hypothetical protein ABWY12_14920, partial [Burkholderiales bacterium]
CSTLQLSNSSYACVLRLPGGQDQGSWCSPHSQRIPGGETNAVFGIAEIAFHATAATPFMPCPVQRKRCAASPAVLSLILFVYASAVRR